MQQVFVIHGGGTFSTYERFIDYLKTGRLEIEKEEHCDWKKNLRGDLKGCEVITPKMPNAQNAQYTEWAIWFERHIPFIQDGVIFVGHSLGAMFLAKYLSENDFPKKIKATLLVAAPFEATDENNLTQFALLPSLQKFINQSKHIHLFHSKDDFVVPFSELHKYQEALPNASVHTFENENHFFHQEHFPELVETIKKLS